MSDFLSVSTAALIFIKRHFSSCSQLSFQPPIRPSISELSLLSWRLSQQKIDKPNVMLIHCRTIYKVISGDMFLESISGNEP